MTTTYLKTVLELLHVTPRLTCSELADRIGIKPMALIDTLRRAVLDGVLSELNGLYALSCPSTSPRPSYPWVEGRLMPSWVTLLASGPRGCESVYVVAETSTRLQEKDGYPPFVLASLDIRLARCICASTGQDISAHIVRYLPFDHADIPREAKA